MATAVAETLRLSYDAEGDILYVESVQPYAEQRSTEIGDGVVARLNPGDRAIEGLEILGFSRRFATLGDQLTLPVHIEMRELPG